MGVTKQAAKTQGVTIEDVTEKLSQHWVTQFRAS